MAIFRTDRVSDTVTVTSDGRSTVDVAKLFNKPHVRNMVRDIRNKTFHRVGTVDQRPAQQPAFSPANSD